MRIRNRLLALIFRIIALASLITLFSFVMNSPTNSWELLVRFGILNALIEIVIFAVEVICNGIDMKRGIKGAAAGIYMPLRLISCAYTVVSFLVFFITTFGLDGSTASLALILLYIALPVFSIGDWLLFCEKGNVKWYYSFSGVIYPLLYSFFLYIRTLVWSDVMFANGGKYPYSILNKNPGEVALVGFLLIVCIAASIALLIFINNCLAGKYKKRISYFD